VEIVCDTVTRASKRVRIAQPTSLLFGHERAKYLGVMDAVIENATDEAVLIPDGQGHPFAFGP
jgi:hypothetical protein